MKHVQDQIVEDLTRASWRMSEAGAELLGELVLRIRTRNVPTSGPLTRSLGTSAKRPWPVRK